MSNLPLVSVCVPTYNGEKYLAQTLESIRVQSYRNLEIVFCDDGSEDGTFELLDAFKKQYPARSAKLITKKDNQGIPTAWNTCLDNASGKYVKFLFQDDILEPDCICKMVDSAESSVRVGIVFSKREIIYSSGNTEQMQESIKVVQNIHEGWTRLEHIHEGQELLADPKLWDAPINKIGEPTAVLFLRSAVNKTGGFDTTLSQLADIDLWLRILQDHDAIFLDEALCKFRIHEKQQTQLNISSKRVEIDRFRLLLKAITHSHYEKLPFIARKSAHNTLNELVAQILFSSQSLTEHNHKLSEELARKQEELVRKQEELARKQEELTRKQEELTRVSEEANHQLQDSLLATHKMWEEKNKWLETSRDLKAELQGIHNTWHWRLRGLVAGKKVVKREALSCIESANEFRSTDLPPTEGVEPNLKQVMELPSSLLLEQFLIEERALNLPKTDAPNISIIIVLYNRVDLTLQCIQSVIAQPYDDYEVIVVDNGSTDQTGYVLKRLCGNANVIYNSENRGFLDACNQGAEKARGQKLLFLNNDTIVLGNSIGLAAEILESSDDIGAVGGRLILPDGTLQEAGSFVEKNGSCEGYGRGNNPSHFEYMFQRDTDYCSGAFLLTRKDLFDKLNGFDPTYKPAYYEEVDFCVRLWKSGKRVVYDPRIVILHYEFASSKKREDAIELQVRNCQKFVGTHEKWLGKRDTTLGLPNVAKRDIPSGKLRILFLEDKVPHQHLGSGFTRSHRIILELVKQGNFVTLFPTNYPDEAWDKVYSDIPRTVEVAIGLGRKKLEPFLSDRIGYYDVILASRPHNLQAIRSIRESSPEIFKSTKLIYDAEALYCIREFTEAALKNQPLSEDEQKTKIQKEIGLTEGCDAVISVSALETDKFAEQGVKNIHTVGFCINNRMSPSRFQERRDILFVGSVHLMASPNADSIKWFSKEVFPKIQKRLNEQCRFIIAGTSLVPELELEINALQNKDIEFVGSVPDLSQIYNQTRIFVAPTRYAAGIPQKVCEAAAYGIPVVSTSLIAQQLGWQNEKELLVADTAEDFSRACTRLYTEERMWANIRENASSSVKKDCSPEIFSKRIKDLLNTVVKKSTS